jgi:hypothetical protein
MVNRKKKERGKHISLVATLLALVIISMSLTLAFNSSDNVLTGAVIGLQEVVVNEEPIGQQINLDQNTVDEREFNSSLFVTEGTIGVQETHLTACGTLEDSVDYVLDNDVLTASTYCFKLYANNITLDCAGYTINSLTTYGKPVYSYNYENITVKNCNINHSLYGVYFLNVTGGTILNNTITTDINGWAYGAYVDDSFNISTQNNTINLSYPSTVQLGAGVYHANSNYSVIQGNVVFTYGTDVYGISSAYSYNSTIENNIITTTGDSAPGMYVTYSNPSIIQNNGVVVSGRDTAGLTFKRSPNSIIQNNNINTTGFNGPGILLDYSSNTILKENVIRTTDFSSHGLELEPSSLNLTIQNNSFFVSNVYDLVIDGNGMGATLIDQNVGDYLLDGNLSFKSSSFGMIEYFADIDVTGNNLNSDIQISNNLIDVDSVSKAGFNQSARITFYGLNNTGHYLLKAGIRCDNTSACDITSDSGGTLIADVDSFSNYSTQEAPDSAPTTTLISPAASYINDTAAITEINFSCNATDDNQLVNISLYLTNSTNQSFVLNQTTDISGTSNSTSWSLNLTTGNYTWNCLAYDNNNQLNWATNRTILLNYTPDNYPTWSTNATNIVSTYSSSTASEFNITWADDNGVSIVYLESNYSGTATNYSMNNIIANVYNYSAILSAGTFYWKSYANDSANQLNETGQWNFTIAQNTENCDVEFNETSPIIYPVAFQAFTNCTTNFTLYRNGTTTNNNSVQSLAVGSYNFTVVRNDSGNYFNYYGEETFVINQANSEVNVTLNNTKINITINRLTTIDLNCTLVSGEDDLYLYNDGTLINSGSSSIGNSTTFSSEGLYNITCLHLLTQNYSASSETYWVNVTDENPNVTLVSPIDNYINDTAALTTVIFNCSATDDLQLQNISLYLTNSTNQSFVLNQTTTISGTSNSSNWTLDLSVGNYTWNCLTYDTNNQLDWANNQTILLNYTAPEIPAGVSDSGSGGGSSSGSGSGSGGGGGAKVACKTNSDCGETELIKEDYCYNNAVYNQYLVNACEDAGQQNAECKKSYVEKIIEECLYGCEDRKCILAPEEVIVVALPIEESTIELETRNWWWSLILLLIPLMIYYIKKRMEHSRLDSLERKVCRRLMKRKTIQMIREEFVGEKWSEKDLNTVFWRIDAVNKLTEYYPSNDEITGDSQYHYPLTVKTLKELKQFVYQRSKQRLMKEHITLDLVQVGWNEKLIEYFVSAHYEPPVSLNTTNFIYSR